MLSLLAIHLHLASLAIHFHLASLIIHPHLTPLATRLKLTQNAPLFLLRIGLDHRGRHVLSEPFQTTPHSLSTLSLHETTLISLVAHQSVHMNGLRLADSVATIDGLQVDERVEVVIRNDYHVCSGQSVPMP